MDKLSNSVKLRAEWFSVRCEDLTEMAKQPNGTSWHRVVTMPGCGYLNRKGKLAANAVCMTKEEARRVAATHRRRHRREGILTNA